MADDEIEIDGSRGCLRSFGQLKGKFTYLKVLLSIGGLNDSAEAFSNFAGDSQARETFAITARQLVIKYGLDGVDRK